MGRLKCLSALKQGFLLVDECETPPMRAFLPRIETLRLRDDRPDWRWCASHTPKWRRRCLRTLESASIEARASRSESWHGGAISSSEHPTYALIDRVTVAVLAMGKRTVSSSMFEHSL